jgi:EpsI family protein
MRSVSAFTPFIVLALGWGLLLRSGQQEVMALREPLQSLPAELVGLRSVNLRISEAEQRVAGMSDYVMRAFGRDSVAAFTLYVGYYNAQIQGSSIHSPKNCLPGAGWEPVSSGTRELETPAGTWTVNRYVIARGGERALVYYWYQGRGRIAANEYFVKWDLLRDKATLRRSEEALVRIVVPVRGTEEEADALADAAAVEVIPEVFRVLPASPVADRVGA